MEKSAFVLVGLSLLGLACNREELPTGFNVNIRVDVSQNLGEVNHIWRFFGADEPNYAYMPNGRKLLGDLGTLRKQEVYFRAHNMLNTGKGTFALKWGSTNAYTEDEMGNSLMNYADLFIRKNRNGATGDLKFIFNNKIPRFEEFNGFQEYDFSERFDNTTKNNKDTPF